MDIHLNMSVSLVVAVIAAEVLSVLWYNDRSPWGRRQGERYFIAAILSDVGLAFLVQWICRNHWSVSKWEDAAILSMWLALLYACLEAPHAVYNAKSFSRFFFHVVHKFAVIFVIAACLFFFKDY